MHSLSQQDLISFYLVVTAATLQMSTEKKMHKLKVENYVIFSGQN